MNDGAGRAGDDIIVVEKHGGIAVWTLNNPTKLNCLNAAMLSRLFELFEGDAEHDAVIITGTGRYFSSGAMGASLTSVQMSLILADHPRSSKGLQT